MADRPGADDEAAYAAFYGSDFKNHQREHLLVIQEEHCQFVGSRSRGGAALGRRLAFYGLPIAIAQDRFAVVTTTVPDLTGRPGTSLLEHLSSSRAAFAAQ